MFAVCDLFCLQCAIYFVCSVRCILFAVFPFYLQCFLLVCIGFFLFAVCLLFKVLSPVGHRRLPTLMDFHFIVVTGIGQSLHP